MWIYGAAAVLINTLLGFIAIIIVPIINKHQIDLIQLLVGLAIGTLTSDALLHLLPHAFKFHNHHLDHSHSNHDKNEIFKSELSTHNETLFYGLVSLIGIISFLTFERLIRIISEFLQTNKQIKSKEVPSTTILDFGYKDSESSNLELNKLKESNKLKEENIDNLSRSDQHELENDHKSQICIQDRESVNEKDDTFIQLHQNHSHHHHHHHLHHHHHHHHIHNLNNEDVKSQSVIWMILTGDGLHQIFDGIAIGVAFASKSIGGGLSTSLAILFHEFPHKVGDFAVLLNAGLTLKRAIFYNLLSCLFSLVGMAIGQLVGQVDINFLSALIAGMFLYIALVSMIPQLECYEGRNVSIRALKYLIQLIGISMGVTIMCLISLYENKIQILLN